MLRPQLRKQNKNKTVWIADCRLIGSWRDSEGLSFLLQSLKGLILGFRSGSLCWDSRTGLQLGVGLCRQMRWFSTSESAQQKVTMKNSFPGSVGSPMVLTFPITITITKSPTAHLSVFWLTIAVERDHCTVEGVVVEEIHPWRWGRVQWNLFIILQDQEAAGSKTRVPPTPSLFPAYFCLFPQSPRVPRAFSIWWSHFLIHLSYLLVCKVHGYRDCLCLFMVMHQWIWYTKRKVCPFPLTWVSYIFGQPHPKGV